MDWKAPGRPATQGVGSNMTIREQIEERERQTLSPFAAKSGDSRGRREPEAEHAYRTAFQRDRDRILHTKSFRRLKRKTQVFLAPQGDHYRTRLTHTLEVSQIARTVARALFLNEDLIEAIALGHDLGHTPFGHAGEAVLNEVCPDGFRHYEQSHRVVEKLESRKGRPGLNLSWEVLDGILWHSKGKAVLFGREPEGPATVEGRVLSLCDAIAYVSHDVDDALRAGIIAVSDLPGDALAALGKTTSERLNTMVTGLIAGTDGGHVGIVPEVLGPLNGLRDFLYREVYPCEAIDAEIRKAKQMLRSLYVDLLAHPTDEIIGADPADTIERRTTDFVAGMTDEYALRLFRERLLPLPWTV